jgi:hypothetical protein
MATGNPQGESNMQNWTKEAPTAKSGRKPFLIATVLVLGGVIWYILADNPPKLPLLGNDATEDCRTLASNPIENGEDKLGKPLGAPLQTMSGPAAVAACSAAIRQEPQDAKSWRRLARAYMASMSFSGLDQRENWPKMVSALETAASLGDIPSRTQLTILNINSSRNRNEILRDSKQLAEQLEKQQLSEPQDIFFHGILLSRILELEANQHARQGSNDPFRQYSLARDFIRGNEGRAMMLFMKALGQGGAIPFFMEAWDLKLQGYCQPSDLICSLAEKTVQSTEDPQIFLAVAIHNIHEAYRIMELRLSRAGNSEQALLKAREAGLTLASNASHYVELAERFGKGKFTESISELRKTNRDFRDYAIARHKKADADAKRARGEAWIALAAVAIVMSANSSSDAYKAPHEQSIGEYVKEMNRQSCESLAVAQSWNQGASEYQILRRQLGC